MWEICRNRLINSYNAGVLVLSAPPPFCNENQLTEGGIFGIMTKL